MTPTKPQPPLPPPININILWDRHETPPPIPANLFAVQARPQEMVLTFAFIAPLLTGTPWEQAEQAEQLNADGGLKPTNLTRVVVNQHVAKQMADVLQAQLAGLEENP